MGNRQLVLRQVPPCNSLLHHKQAGEVTNGLPQGSVLVPRLLNLYNLVLPATNEKSIDTMTTLLWLYNTNSLNIFEIL